MALATRIIACLDVKDGRVVKGVNFTNLRDAGDPVELALRYYEEGVDELTFLDVSASLEQRATTHEMVRRTAEQVFIPLTVGGGVSKLEHVDALLQCGADKVSVNSAAIARPALVTEIAERFGSQVLVVSLDVRRSPHQPSGFTVTTHGGTRDAEIDAIAWLTRVTELGAGEILLNSMDADGTKEGFDTQMLALCRQATNVPLIASGGAGELAHFAAAVEAGADAVLAASVFHDGLFRIDEVKRALQRERIEVRT